MRKSRVKSRRTSALKILFISWRLRELAALDVRKRGMGDIVFVILPLFSCAAAQLLHVSEGQMQMLPSLLDAPVYSTISVLKLICVPFSFLTSGGVTLVRSHFRMSDYT